MFQAAAWASAASISAWSRIKFPGVLLRAPGLAGLAAGGISWPGPTSSHEGKCGALVSGEVARRTNKFQEYKQWRGRILTKRVLV